MLFVCGCLIAVRCASSLVGQYGQRVDICDGRGAEQCPLPSPPEVPSLNVFQDLSLRWLLTRESALLSINFLQSHFRGLISPKNRFECHEISGFFSKLSPTCDQMGLLSHTTHADMFISGIFSLIQPRTLNSLFS